MSEVKHMSGKEQVVKHLEIIQGVINRLGHDSFLIKGWSMTILAAGMIFLARSNIQSECFVLAFLVPIFGFWVLDGYYLCQERRFREVYNEIRGRETTDFAMEPKKHKNKPGCTWLASMFSCPLAFFYVIEYVFVAIVFFFINFWSVTNGNKTTSVLQLPL